MAEALRLDILIDEDGRAQAALNELYRQFRAAGDSAVEAAEKVEKFEKSYKDTSAKKEAARALDEVTRSSRNAGNAATTAKGQTDQFSSALGDLKSTAISYAAPAAIGAAILKTIEWADHISDAAERTKLTTTQVQQLSKMAEKNGSSFQQMAGMIQTVEQRLASHNKKAEEAVKLLGMSSEKLLELDPLERLRAVAKALADLEDPAQRSAAEVAILGRSSDEASVALNNLASGADKAENALGPGFVQTGNEMMDVLDKIKDKALDAGRALVLLAFSSRSYLPGRQFDQGGDMPTAPVSGSTNADGSFSKGGLWKPAPSPFETPGDPMGFGGVGGNSMRYIEETLKIKPEKESALKKKEAAALAAWFTAQRLKRDKMYGSFATPAPTLDSWKIPQADFGLTNEMTASRLGIGFDHDSVMVPFTPGVKTYSEIQKLNGGSGGLKDYLKNNKAAIGIGVGTMAARYLGGKLGGKAGGALSGAAQGAQMGMMFGPWGAAVGGVVGGVAGWIGAGKAAKNAKNAETSQVFEQFSSKEFIDLQKQADRLGISLQKALTSKTMKDFTAATEEAAKKVKELVDLEDQIASLKEQSTVTFDKMNDIVNEFGLDVSKIGPAFQQALTDKDSKRIIDAMAVMERGGADMSGVLDGMADEINGVVLDSIKFGTTIPENMKPWIEELIKSGKLVDENGEKITDVSKLKFGAAMESEMSKVVKKLDELIEKLAELTKGFQGATGAANDLSNVNYPDPGGAGGSGSDPGGAGAGVWRGGVVGKDNILYFKRGGFVPHGTDTVPAMLTPGEMVIARDQVKAMTKRGAGRSITVNMNIAGYLDSPKVQRELARVVQDAIDSDVRSVRVG